MKINVIAIGTGMPTWITTGFNDYAKRLPRDYSLHLIECSAEKRTKHVNRDKLLKKESDRLLKAVPKGNIVILLDRTGKPMTSQSLSHCLKEWHGLGQSISLLIGGPEGVPDDFLKKANYIWSLSYLTLPHTLVRIILAEQIYRAWSIIAHHPYHR